MERRTTAGLCMVKALLVVPLAVMLSATAGLSAPSAQTIRPATVNHFEGTWIYAKDPMGVVPTESIYDGSTITFGPGGKYSFQLARRESRYKARGRCVPRATPSACIRNTATVDRTTSRSESAATAPTVSSAWWSERATGVRARGTTCLDRPEISRPAGNRPASP
jgi:hypothetical protein